MRRLNTFCLILITSILVAQDFKVIGYMPSYRWAAKGDIDYDKLTHVFISFVNPNSQDKPKFPVNPTSLITAAHEKNVEVFFSIAGGSASGTQLAQYTTILNDDTKRETFINDLYAFAENYKLDGIDIDLEGSALSIDKYNTFVIEVAKKFHDNGLKCTAALPQWTGNKVSDNALASLDWLNLMAYDNCGPSWGTTPCQHSPMSRATSDVNYWKNTRKVPAKKLVLGVPFYGNDFSQTPYKAINFSDVVSQYPNNIYDDQVTGKDIFYNGINTIQAKTGYAYKQELDGIMIWEIAQDVVGANSLLTAIDDKKKELILNVTEKTIEDFIDISPNPFTNTLSIDIKEDVEKITLLNTDGVIVQSIIPTNISINTQKLNKGMYILMIHTNTKTYSTKLIKQ